MGKVKIMVMRGRAWILTMLVSLLLSLIPVALGSCLTNSDCGSAVQPGLCLGAEGICQCGFGYQGNVPLQPTACTFNCTPKEISSSGFLNDPDVNITVQENELVLRVVLDPYAEQEPAKMRLAHPDSPEEDLKPLPERAGQISQQLDQECRSHYVYRQNIFAIVEETCFLQSQPDVYTTHLEILQVGRAPFASSARQRQVNDAIIQRNYRIVLTLLKTYVEDNEGNQTRFVKFQ